MNNIKLIIIFLFLSTSTLAKPLEIKTGTITLSGKIFADEHYLPEQSKWISDSTSLDQKIVIKIWDRKPIYDGNQLPHREFVVARKNGEFYIVLDSVPKVAFLSIGLDNRRYKGEIIPILDSYIIEQGDSVYMHITPNHNRAVYLYPGAQNYVSEERNYLIKFSGVGYEKYQAQYYCNRMMSRDLVLGLYRHGFGFTINEEESNTPGSTTISALDEYLKVQDESLDRGLKELRLYESVISSDVYALIETNLVAKTEVFKIHRITTIKQYSKDENVQLKVDSVYKSRYPIFDTNEKLLADVSPRVKSLSQTYLFYSLLRIKIDKKMMRQGSDISVLESIIKKSCGVLRESILTGWFLNDYKNNFSDSLIQELFNVVQDPELVALLHAKRDAAAIGSKVSYAELYDVGGKAVSLNDLLGKVVFMDLWYTGCPGCAMYYQNTLMEIEEKYRDNPYVVFVSVNIDNKKELWLNSIKGGLYTNKHVLNLHTGDLGKEHPFIKDFKVIGYPSPFLIDHTGTIINKGAPLFDGKLLIEEIELALEKKRKNHPF